MPARLGTIRVMPRLLHPMLVAAPVAWLSERGKLPTGFDASVLRSEGVPIETQRDLLSQVVEVGGEKALLSLGEKMLLAKDEPLLFVMLNSSSVRDFIDKEQRFNRFFHTDHRVRVHESRDDLLELEHVGPSERPHRWESLYVLGLHLAVLIELGCQGLCVRLPESDVPARVVFEDGERVTPPSGAVHRWRFEWRRFVPRRQPFAGLDELLLSQNDPRDLEAERSLDDCVRRLVDSDLSKRWVIGEVAAALGRSARTLQRELSALGTSFSRLVEEQRVAAATKLLADPNRSITEIGYVCGFADTAHFSRRFKACTKMTPSAFRDRPAVD